MRYNKLGEPSQERESLESSWFEGVWLGHARGSSEALVGTKDGVVRAWTIRRMPEGERWDAEAITEMQGTPSRLSAAMPGLRVPIAINIEEGNSIRQGPQKKLRRGRRRRRPGESI